MNISHDAEARTSQFWSNHELLAQPSTEHDPNRGHCDLLFRCYTASKQESCQSTQRRANTISGCSSIQQDGPPCDSKPSADRH